MVIHELTPAECREVLRRASHGRLGCARADQPYVVPFSFFLAPAGDCLYSFSTLGQKIDWMRGNPRVCVEVDEIVDQLNWTTVLAFGRYQELLRDSRQDEDERRRAYELFQQRSAWWLPGVGKLASGEEHHTPIVYRILIDKLTGRRATRPAKSPR
jgi:nitroimidazol reductase NimA-like FMN-containing flavoprotein (pyridoxamine 5'-phosphate oxidase superfamily)